MHDRDCLLCGGEILLMSKIQEKQQKIIHMFDAIAKTYDTTNRIVSFKQDQRWRLDGIRRALKYVYAFKGDLQDLEIADVACGTADMLLHILKEVARLQGSVASIRGIDPSREMLAIAKNKIENLDKQKTEIYLDCLEAKDLSTLEDNSLDFLSIAYGLRNILERKRALQEFSRVLKKKGVLLVLEFMRQDRPGILGSLARFYTAKILPLLGMLISRNYRAYAYLPSSIDNFISPSELEEELSLVDLEVVEKTHYVYNSVSGILAVKF